MPSRKKKSNSSNGSTPVVKKMSENESKQQLRAQPLAQNNQLRSRQIKTSVAPVHPSIGKPGMRIMGVQQLCNVITGSTTGSPQSYSLDNLYTQSGNVGGGSTNLSGYAFPALVNATSGFFYGYSIDPSALGGPMAVKTTSFVFYVFRKCRFHYVTECSSLTPGAIALGIIDDPAAYSDLNTTSHAGMYAQIKSLENSVVTPRRENVTLDYSFNGSKLWALTSGAQKDQTDIGLSSTNLSNARMETQFVLAGAQDMVIGTDGTTNQTMGSIQIEYVLDLYESRPVAFTNYLMLKHISQPHLQDVHEYLYIKLRSFLLDLPDEEIRKMMFKTRTDTRVHPLITFLSSRGDCSYVPKRNLYDAVLEQMAITNDQEQVDVSRVDQFLDKSEPSGTFSPFEVTVDERKISSAVVTKGKWFRS
jgi:hypothetical protein